MLIRPWQKEDNAKISLLEQQCFSDPWYKEMIENAFCQFNFLGFVACENQQVVGYIGGQSLFEDGEILLVAVDESQRGKGFGKSLVEAFSTALKKKGVEKIFLEVRKSNFVAINCYARCGFLQIAERKGYYSNGEDALIMEKKL